MSDMEQRLDALMVMVPDLGGCRGAGGVQHVVHLSPAGLGHIFVGQSCLCGLDVCVDWKHHAGRFHDMPAIGKLLRLDWMRQTVGVPHQLLLTVRLPATTTAACTALHSNQSTPTEHCTTAMSCCSWPYPGAAALPAGVTHIRPAGHQQQAPRPQAAAADCQCERHCGRQAHTAAAGHSRGAAGDTCAAGAADGRPPPAAGQVCLSETGGT